MAWRCLGSLASGRPVLRLRALRTSPDDLMFQRLLPACLVQRIQTITFFFPRSNAAAATGLGLFTLRPGGNVLLILRLFPRVCPPSRKGGSSKLSGKAGPWTSGDRMRSPKIQGGRLENPRLTKKYLGLDPGCRRGGTDGGVRRRADGKEGSRATRNRASYLLRV
ncbi:hypothetical protein LZ32DRAFT_410023 [Colletotrichum eremochloae]|nr:hypothetical protein LZ32DRAFT_410023 [Colletotrichum eremochloae]